MMGLLGFYEGVRKKLYMLMCLVLCSPPFPTALLIPERAHNEEKIKLTLKYTQQLFYLLHDIFSLLSN